MNNRHALAKFAWVCLGALPCLSQGVPPRTSLQALLERIPAVAKGESGVGPEEQELAKGIQAFGREAASRLIPLLKSENPSVRAFAGFVLRDVQELEEGDLDALIAAHDRGDGWIPPAIGRIGTPKAISHLVAHLRNHPEMHTQVTGALVNAGERAAAQLGRAFLDSEPMEERALEVFGAVLNEMKDSAKSAVPLLVQAIQDPSVSLKKRLGAVQALGRIGPPAAAAVPALKALAESLPAEFGPDCEESIICIGTKDALEILLPVLLQKPNPFLVMRIANLGPNGRAAGPVLQSLLAHSDWEIRLAACGAIGSVGYTAGKGSVEAALDNQDDWRLVQSAIQSLQRIGNTESIAFLQEVVDRHWKASTRALAAKAIQIIRREPTPLDGVRMVVGSEEEIEGPEHSQELGGRRGITFASVQEKYLIKASELGKHPYTASCGWSDPDGTPGPDIQATPVCGVRTPFGLLLGGDRGEWGGELVFKDLKGNIRVLVEENTHAIHSTAAGWIAVCGLAHLGLDSGFLYRVEFGPDGLPTTSKWKALPGAPLKSGISVKGDLYVSCTGGDIIVGKSGKIRTR